MTRADWARPKIGLIVGSRLCARILLDRVVEIRLLCESAPMRKPEAGVSPPQSRFLLFIGSTLASLSQSGRLTASAVKCCPIPRFALTRTVSVLSKHSSLKKKRTLIPLLIYRGACCTITRSTCQSRSCAIINILPTSIRLHWFVIICLLFQCQHQISLPASALHPWQTNTRQTYTIPHKHTHIHDQFTKHSLGY